MKVYKYILILIIFPLVVFSKPSNDEIYTLYRNSVLDESMRLHVATFDAENGKETHSYNMSNCMIAQELFQNQPYVKTKFWCEKGKFRK